MNTALALPALAETPRSVWRTGGIVVLYTAVFFGLLPLLVWELGHAFDRGFVLDALPRAVRPLGAALFGGGALLMLAAMAALAVRGRGWPISHLPPRLLVARGLYSRLRHPIYVGYVAATAGAGPFEASVGRGLLAPLVLAAGTFVYARDFEEPRLVARFGPAYSAYVQVTPLLPAAFTGALAGLAKRAWLRARP
ncbi:MAG TPA: methyltransferase, partial [Polyangiaceae bacterium]